MYIMYLLIVWLYLNYYLIIMYIMYLLIVWLIKWPFIFKLEPRNFLQMFLEWFRKNVIEEIYFKMYMGVAMVTAKISLGTLSWYLVQAPAFFLICVWAALSIQGGLGLLGFPFL